MAQVTGRVFFKINGRLYNSKEGAKLKFTGPDGVGSREPVLADRGPVGYKDKVEASEVTATIAHTADVSLTDLLAIVDATLTYETDTGRSFILRGAFCQNALELASGEVSVMFGAIGCEEA